MTEPTIVPVHPELAEDAKPPVFVIRPGVAQAAAWLAGQMEQAQLVARVVTGPGAAAIFERCCQPAGLYLKRPDA